MAYYVVICDIDNCFTDSRDWVPPANATRKNWDEYLERIDLCKPNRQVIDVVCATADILPVIFITGREDRHSCRHDTIVQIKEFSNGVIDMQDPDSPHKLLMRDEFDYRPSQLVKEEKLLLLIQHKYIPTMAIDDEIENCKMYMKYSIPCTYYDIEKQEFRTCKYEDEVTQE